ncbi:hypothetical protein BIW11_03238 [Tropilaelaps mercedesae]|uniref:Uncharacterized protein n=1 Tax=Tropilaelaps mercedesae TaxID=418985 RepID=A0A1V9XQ03_9ACAR|nr:hypothetical protein BIW11_03238 [Tropilaelaps mercedesae]
MGEMEQKLSSEARDMILCGNGTAARGVVTAPPTEADANVTGLVSAVTSIQHHPPLPTNSDVLDVEHLSHCARCVRHAISVCFSRIRVLGGLSSTPA